MNNNNFSYHLTLDQYESLTKLINQGHALVDVASTVDFTLFEQPVLREYFSLAGSILREAKEQAQNVGNDLP